MEAFEPEPSLWSLISVTIPAAEQEEVRTYSHRLARALQNASLRPPTHTVSLTKLSLTYIHIHAHTLIPRVCARVLANVCVCATPHEQA